MVCWLIGGYGGAVDFVPMSEELFDWQKSGLTAYNQRMYVVLKIKRFALTANALAGLYSVPIQESDSYGSSLQWDEGFLFGAEMECKFFVLKNLALQLSGGFTNIGASFNAGLSLSI